MKNAYDIMPVGKRRNVFIVTQQKPRRRKLRGFFSVLARWISPQADYQLLIFYPAICKCSRQTLAYSYKNSRVQILSAQRKPPELRLWGLPFASDARVKYSFRSFLLYHIQLKMQGAIPSHVVDKI